MRRHELEAFDAVAGMGHGSVESGGVGAEAREVEQVEREEGLVEGLLAGIARMVGGEVARFEVEEMRAVAVVEEGDVLGL